MMFKKAARRSVILCLAIALASAATSLPNRQMKAHAADAYDDLRAKYVEMLTGGSSYDTSDPDVAARIAEITATASDAQTKMYRTPTRNRLWPDAALGSDSAGITFTYRHVRDMALAYRTEGSSLEGDPALKADILDALDWMNANQFYVGKSKYQNWWHWEIGGPVALNDVVALMYDELSAAQIADNMAAINYMQPSVAMTGANRMWEVQVIALEGMNAKDGAKITAALDGIDALLPYVLKGDGYYADGSFIQHTHFAYTGGYGASLISSLADILYLFAGSSWSYDDPNMGNVYQWIYDSYEPLIYKGNLMDMVRGREISRWRSQDNAASAPIISAIVRLSDIAPAPHGASFKSMVKYWLQEDPENDYLKSVSIDLVLEAKEMLSASAVVSRGELVEYRQFAGMDRALALRPGYGFGISMSSDRIGNYEWSNADNNKGYHTGDGMTYLYTSDLAQFNDNFWPTVNSFRLPGTTVLKDHAQDANTKPPSSWAGGTDMLGLYGTSGMEYVAAKDRGTTTARTLTAKKSWFMFDDEIVALGAGITSADGIATETIVENRKLNAAGNNALTVDGTTQSSSLGWSDTLVDTDYIHLAGNVPGSDVGYYFPGGTTVKALREARTGNWKQLSGAAGWSDTPYTRNYLTLWLDHGISPTNGSYAYVLLPNKTSAQVGSYAASPDIAILENSASAQAVKENGLNITGINFWTDAPKTAGLVTSYAKASVMTRETASELEVSVSDPTQDNAGMLYFEVAKNAKDLISKDGEVTILQYSPTIKFKVNVNKAAGKSFKVKFSLAGTQAPNPAPIPVPAAYEAETLPIQSMTDGVTVYNDNNASGAKKLGLINNAVGDYTEFSLDVPEAGVYGVFARIGKATSNGIYQLSINGVDQGAEWDGYWTTSELYRDLSLGTYSFDHPGSYLFRLTVKGKNPSAAQYRLMLDKFTLT
ncbi:polysaccharide lyase family 8 super-sandwich domain-containing protein [Cohnella hashimotonis]|uniref:Polysaccharide lyase family 8 super-sandwich domain-containing protein n=1 Tax=Cohnella hashimotonis TaxID=2826895 RepID=A0ABT6TAV2_9BACL|nr:polysaccharide lyase family 8 super-sandwich domain-containing protein [Cohnella hashimotonis]MDI4643967.1 polysaccharide lyase family 8 super-sandwich domain-containing protein [Cohnella hashimotonis]